MGLPVVAEAALQPPGNRLDPVLEEWHSRNHRWSLCGDQGTTRRHRNPRSAEHESCRTTHGAAPVLEIRQRFRDSASGGQERNHKGKGAATATEHRPLKFSAAVDPAQDLKL